MLFGLVTVILIVVAGVALSQSLCLIRPLKNYFNCANVSLRVLFYTPVSFYVMHQGLSLQVPDFY